MPADIETAKLLLVEDSEDDVFFFKRTLQKSGIPNVIEHAPNGSVAVEMLTAILRSDCKGLPGVVFLDLKMPVLNGFEVLEWIRTQAFPSRMQVVVLSGSEHQEDRERTLRMGATAYLVKPVKVADLERFLKKPTPVPGNGAAS